MINSGFEFIATMLGLCGLLVWAEQKYHNRFFQWFPSIVLIMFSSMALYTVGAWELTPEIRTTRSAFRDNLIPAMLFLMSLKFNLVVIRKLGIRLIGLCLISTLSIVIGFVLVQLIMNPILGDETPLTFGAMSAGWTGGTQNFVAVKEALGVTDTAMTYTLLMGALCYSVWLVIIIGLKPFKSRFDHFLQADNRGIDQIFDALDNADDTATDFQSLLLMLGLSLFVGMLSLRVGDTLAGTGIFNQLIWAIIISTFLGMLLAPTSIGKLTGSNEISGIMLYLIVALIGAEVSLGALVEAPLYILSGFMILAIHAVILLFTARLLRMNLYLVGIASIANIGSSPSAAVVGAAYDKRLVPVAIMMSLIGSLLGSFVGLGVARILLVLNA